MIPISNLTLIIFVLFAIANTAFSYPPPDSCLKTFDITEDSTFSNPEDVRVDSCSESSTYTEFYGKKFFNARFNYNLIPRNGIFPEDTIIEYGINDIDIIYTQAIADFQALETEFGTFKFRESRPDFTDTTTLIKRSLFINFDNYVNIDTAIKRIKLFDCIESIDFRGWFEVSSKIPTDAMMHPPTLLSTHRISSSPDTDKYFPPSHHKRGWHWGNFSLKTALAWEITYGDSNIFIGAKESLEGTITHPDMTSNYKVISNNDGKVQTDLLGWGHGLATLSCAIADQDNGFPLVGTAPDCSGFLKNSSSGNFDELDVDGLTNSIITLPHVVYECVGYRHTPINLMKNGIVSLGAAMNYITIQNNIYYPHQPIHMHQCFEDPLYPGNIDKSLKVISVAGISDGVFLDKNCATWKQDDVLYSNWTGEDRFISWDYYLGSANKSGAIYNFSISNEKFSPTLAERTKAFVDVVVPSTHIINAGFANGVADWEIGNGTSQGVAMAAGVVGLMRSINLDLSQDPNDSTQSNLSDIHRTAYDIVTFTADKIHDDGLTPDKIGTTKVATMFYDENPDKDGLSFQFHYLVQELDILKRTWAQRVGFGRLNAYRSVAHSIRQKGLYEYAPTSLFYTIPFSSSGGGSTTGFSLSGINIMHWGAKVKEGSGDFEMDIKRGPNSTDDGILNVLEYGGVSLPGEFHNNQGVTLINNSSSPSRTQFLVPTNSLLAIDGILTTDQPSASHYVVTDGTGSNAGKILAEGYIKDVEIFGNLRVGDITVTSSLDNGAGAIGFGPNHESEVYGEVYVKENGYFYLLGNCNLKPGAIVNLDGEKDCFTAGISELHMGQATKFTTKTERKLIINDGTKLVVDNRAVAELDLEVLIKDGGELVIEDSARVKIKFLNVERGGIVTLNKGSYLALEEQEHYINGKLLVSGLEEDKVTITGYIKENCEPYNHEDYVAFKYIETTPIIYMQGHCDSLDKSQLDLQNVDFKDISLNAFNIPVYQTIRNVNFQTKSRENNPYFHFPYLFSLNFDNCADCTNPFVQNIRLSNCSFKDYSQPMPPANEPGNNNKLEFRTAGISIEGYDQVEISNTSFNNLEFGVSTFDCNKVLIKSSTFDSCGIGDYDFGSETFLCQNDYNIVKYGSVRDHSLQGRAFNNTYTKTLIGYNAVSSDEQRFRGNDFTEYLKGISSSCTELVLADKLVGGNYLIYGRNKFSISPLIPDLSEYINPFLRKSCLVSESADINLNKSCCALTMRCGLNQMSSNSTYHLQYNGTGTFGPIDINYNTFSDPLPGMYVPRTLGVSTIYGGMPNIDFRWTGQDSLCCGDWAIDTSEYNCPPPVTHGTEIAACSPINLFGIPYPPIARKGYIYEGDYATTHKKEVLDWISDLDGNEVIKSYKFEKETGHEYSQRRESLNDLLIDYSRNQLNDLSSYDTPYNSHPNIVYSKDKKANQIQGVSLLGFVDRIMGIDCSQSQSTTDVENNELFASVSINEIAPNPTNNLITVDLSSDKSIRLSINVVDQLGKTVSTLFDGQISYGKTNKQFDISNLTSGIYYITFEWSSNRITKKIILNK